MRHHLPPPPHRPSPAPRPVRLTRRGRLVLLGLCLLVGALVAAVVAPASQAADPAANAANAADSAGAPGADPAGTSGGEPRVAVVRPGDTLWSVAARHVPSQDPYGMIEEIQRLNDLPGLTIHPGQELVLPERR